MDSTEMKFLDYGINDFNSVIAIFDDLNFIKCSNFDDAKKVDPFLIAKHTITGTFPLYSDPERPKFSFDIFDKKLTPYNIQCNGWVILNFDSYYYRGIWITELVIKSPDKEVKQLKLENLAEKYNLSTRVLEEVIALQKFINSFRLYKDWNYYVLKSENDDLKKQIDDLSRQIEMLKVQIKK